MRLLAIAMLAGCAESPHLHRTEPPPDADLVIATAIDSIERHAPQEVTVPWPEASWLDQDTVLESEGGFTNVNRLLGQPCNIYIIVRPEYPTSVAHELIHCAIAATDCGLRPDTDPDHQLARWWSILPAVEADVGAALL